MKMIFDKMPFHPQEKIKGSLFTPTQDIDRYQTDIFGSGVENLKDPQSYT